MKRQCCTSRRCHSPMVLRYCSSSAVSFVGDAYDDNVRRGLVNLGRGSHLIGEHRHGELPRQERIQNLIDDLAVRTARNVGLEAHVRELRLGSDMDRHVTALMEIGLKINDVTATQATYVGHFSAYLTDMQTDTVTTSHFRIRTYALTFFVTPFME